MKKILFFIALFFTAIVHSIDQHTNQTFMFPKEIFGSFGMEQASWNNIVYNKKSYGHALQVYGYAQKSIPDAEDSEYFLFDDLKSLVVQSGVGVGPDEESFTRNILGAWIGIPDSAKLSSTYSLTPKQSQHGATIGFSQDLSKYCDMGFLRNLSFNVSIPIVSLKNQLVYQGSPEVLSALQGKNAESMGMLESWNYLILNTEAQEATTFTNMKILFGTNYQSEDDIQIATTSFVILPFVDPVSNEVLFQPMEGYNGHVVMGAGVLFQFPLSISQDKRTRICFYTGLENKLLLGNTQQRTCEIDGKPYSRYMPIYDRYTETVLPGVNVFTKDFYIEPFNLINFIAGFRYKYADSVTEIGYEVWGRDTEKISFSSNKENDNNFWQENRYGIANINPETFELLVPQTASASTINYIVPDAVDNVYIKAKNLNFKPAVARSALVHRAYMTIGYGKNTDRISSFLNGGLFMEISQNNAAISNWGGWAKAGMTF